MTPLITQPISNSKAFADVKRNIEILGINMNADAQTFDLYY